MPKGSSLGVSFLGGRKFRDGAAELCSYNFEIRNCALPSNFGHPILRDELVNCALGCWAMSIDLDIETTDLRIKGK